MANSGCVLHREALLRRILWLNAEYSSGCNTVKLKVKVKNVLVKELLHSLRDCIFRKSYYDFSDSNFASLDAGRTETGGIPVPYK